MRKFGDQPMDSSICLELVTDSTQYFENDKQLTKPSNYREHGSLVGSVGSITVPPGPKNSN